MNLLGPFNTLAQEDRLVIIEGECFQTIEAFLEKEMQVVWKSPSMDGLWVPSEATHFPVFTVVDDG